MQQIRAIKADDYQQLKEIHEKFFSGEFEFPDFVRHYLCAFLIQDESNNIISAGGVRTITEAVMITDKSYPILERKQALENMLTALIYTSKIAKYDQLHAFVQDEKWKRHLLKSGFNPTKGQSLVLEI